MSAWFVQYQDGRNWQKQPRQEGDKGPWTAHQDMNEGDFALLYARAPISAFVALFQAITDAAMATHARKYDFVWDWQPNHPYWCEVRFRKVFRERLTLAAMRQDPTLQKWGRVRGQMQAPGGVPPRVPEEYLQRLGELIPELRKISTPQGAVPKPTRSPISEGGKSGRATATARNGQEGEPYLIVSLRYDRAPALRKGCKEKYGYDCAVCGFNFAKKYGELGEGFIHVHHLKPLAGAGGEHEVSVDDLRPVCPNCHSMLHHNMERGEARSIEELKKIVRELSENRSTVTA